MTIVLFAAAAGLGGAVRHAVNQRGWHWIGTLIVNVIGSFALGWLTGSESSSSTATVLGTGFLGALTTFSMFAVEVAEARPVRRLAIVTTNVGLGLGAAAAGFALA